MSICTVNKEIADAAVNVLTVTTPLTVVPSTREAPQQTMLHFARSC